METATAKAAPGHARWGRDVKTLAGARREFAHKRSPWMILGAIVALATLRAWVGELTWRDVVAVVAMLVVYPFGEWAIHVYVLHLRPVRLPGRRVELPAARAHRQHHEHPNDLSTVLLDPLEVALLIGLAIPLVVLAGGVLASAIAGGGLAAGPLVSAALIGAVLVGLYEWCHFLIHTAYRPRTRLYREVWRTHRLHHFKNERYWHGITSTVADRLLGTFPDQREVPRSGTARTLDPGPAG
jgi:hypothetical protein